MLIKLLIFPVLVIAGGLCCDGQVAVTHPSYKFLRYEDDYRFLRDPARRTDLWDWVNYIPLGQAGFLSFGGEARERFETYNHEFFSLNPAADNAYFLQRYLLHLDYHPTEWLRVFAQLQSSLEGGRPAGPRPTDRDAIDTHQLFLDLVQKSGYNRELTVRIGRQEMSYGTERLIAAREGPNNRRAFDEARLLFTADAIRLDLFFGSPVEIDQGPFDDQNVRDVWFWGGYGRIPCRLLPESQLELYYLGFRSPWSAFNQGIAREERHTLGARFFGNKGAWDYNDEAIYQLGCFGSGEIVAWSVATDHGYTLRELWGRPRVGLRAAAASGDRNAQDQDLQTFNPLFARGNYFTEAGLLSPQNFIDLFPSVRVNPLSKVVLDLGFDFHWRESSGDGIYRPGGSIIYRGNDDFSRFVGTELVFGSAWQATRHLTLSTAYSHFFAGAFIRENRGDDADFGALWLTFRF